MNLHSTSDVHLPIIFGKQIEIESKENGFCHFSTQFWTYYINRIYSLCYINDSSRKVLSIQSISYKQGNIF